MQKVNFFHSIKFRIMAAILFMPILFTIAGFFLFQQIESRRIDEHSKIRLLQLERLNTGLMINKMEAFKEKSMRLASDNQIIVPYKLGVQFQLNTYLSLLLEQNGLESLALITPDNTVASLVGKQQDKLIITDIFSAECQKSKNRQNITQYCVFHENDPLSLLSFTPVISGNKVIAVLMMSKVVKLDGAFSNVLLVNSGKIQSQGSDSSFLKSFIDKTGRSPFGPILLPDKAVFSSKLPIPGYKGNDSYLFVGLDRRKEIAKNRRIISFGITGGVIIILLFLFFYSFLFSKRLTKPLIQIVKIANKISSNKRNVRWLPKRYDEIGLLNQSLKKMTAILQDNINQLNITREEAESARAKLESSEERYKNMIATASKVGMGIALFQDDGKETGLVKYVNKGMADLFGYTKEKLLQMNIKDIMSNDSYEKLIKSYPGESLQKGFLSSIDIRGVKKGGEKFPLQFCQGTTEFEGRQTSVCFASDITEKIEAEKKLKEYSQNLERLVDDRTGKLKQTILNLKTTQAELIQSEKLAAIGQLAAGIAHEINTPTQYVGDNTRFIQDSFPDILKLIQKFRHLLADSKAGPLSAELISETEQAWQECDMKFLAEEIPQAIGQSLEGLSRITKIVQAMKEFAHPGIEEKIPIDINAAIESTITVARNEWKYIAEMETDLNTGLPEVLCLPGDFNQVILNLIVNAVHTIKDVNGDGSHGKGMIRVATRLDGDHVEIQVQDTGAGIPEEIQSRIFDPFFTTKEVGIGTGQGLAISRSVIVEKHGGTITFKTNPDKGTTFIVRLPIEANI
ncbi:MAG TPA: hypothetical protein DDW42_08985 [Desulfobacteraceae bacterium]|nr:hypothetical protein [Desulfobacteraceae bacterium]